MVTVETTVERKNNVKDKTSSDTVLAKPVKLDEISSIPNNKSLVDP